MADHRHRVRHRPGRRRRGHRRHRRRHQEPAGTKNVFDQFRFASAGSISTWFIDDVYIRNDATWGP